MHSHTKKIINGLQSRDWSETISIWHINKLEEELKGSLEWLAAKQTEDTI